MFFLQRCLQCALVCSFLVILLLPEAAFARRANRSTSRSYTPKILSRADWGADETLGLVKPGQQEMAEDTGETGAAPIAKTLSARDKRCLEAKKVAPEDFEIRNIEHTDPQENHYVWPRRYSKEVKMIVIHHTGEHRKSESAKLRGKERVRSIYYTHTVKNGWGDIGYHYLIDEDGQIYEGRAGGPSVVGAHVYCANVGTVGIAMIGNFQVREEPTEAQLQSLRWLTIELAGQYGINPSATTMFQGREVPTVVTHRMLAPTQCAGRNVQRILPLLKRYIGRRDYTSPILGTREATRRSYRTDENMLIPTGSTSIRIPPSGSARITMNYQAGKKAVKLGERIARVERSNRSIGLWQHRRGSKIRLRNDIRAEKDIRKGSSTQVNFTVLAPRTPGIYRLTIGNTVYTIEAEGRRARRR